MACCERSRPPPPPLLVCVLPRPRPLSNAAHDFYQETLILFSLIEDNLTEEAFPSMTAGPKYEYFWQDETEYKTPTQLPAKKYIQRLLAWVDEYLSDASVFPTDSDMVFPDNFRSVVQRIFRRLFRIYAPIYYHHWDSIRSMGADAHLNTCFKHFIFFVRRFDLISSEELAPLDELIASFLADHDASGAAGSGGAAAAGASAADS